MPALPVGDDVQESLCGWHVVGVAGGDRFPDEAARVGLGDAERVQEPGLSVGAVVGEGLAGPFAGDQDAGLVPERVGQAVGMVVLGGGGGLVAVGDVLGQVLGQVADSAGRVA
jgi:hypothetical protein